MGPMNMEPCRNVAMVTASWRLSIHWALILRFVQILESQRDVPSPHLHLVEFWKSRRTSRYALSRIHAGPHTLLSPLR